MSILSKVFTILTILLSTFVFAGCPVVKKKELSPPPPEPVMETSSEQPTGVRIIVAPPEDEDY